jgi:methionine synthase II (cobalamin-independent)
VFSPFTTTGIGSLPYKEPDRAVKLVLEGCDIPFWPQLPRRSFRELMIPQYSEGFPAIKEDAERKEVFLSEITQDELNAFYEKAAEEKDFPLSPDYAAGFYAFEDALRGRKLKALKGQITGPLTFSLGLKDHEGRYIYFNEELREVTVMLLSLKAHWQIKRLNAFSDRVIIFIDEPILSALGSSSYLGVDEKEALRMLSSVVDAIHSHGAVSGIHCCGKADWAMVIKSGVKILNFDAFDYFDAFRAYEKEIAGFIERGGLIAWGVVPTTEAINSVNHVALKDKLLYQIKELSKVVSEDRLIKHSLLTPSCGAGGRSQDEAERVFELLAKLREALLS